MAFELSGLARVSSSDNTISATIWAYLSAVDTFAAITTPNYFDPIAGYSLTLTNKFTIGDLIYIVGTDTEGFANVTQVYPHVIVNAFNAVIGAGAVGTANIQNLAITTALLAANAVTAAKIANNTITSTQVATSLIQFSEVAMTAAQWNGMYAAPMLLVAAPGVGLLLALAEADYSMTFVAAAYAAGGVVNIQYDNTVHGAGVQATQDTAAATVTGIAASSWIPAQGNVNVANAFATTVDKGFYLSNKTAAFTTGDGTWNIPLAYRVVTA